MIREAMEVINRVGKHMEHASFAIVTTRPAKALNEHQQQQR